MVTDIEKFTDGRQAVENFTMAKEKDEAIQ